MNKYRFLSAAFAMLATLSFAQVPKRVIVEHFTNTRCSICASRNPDFYNFLASEPGMLHISFHPSSPYSDCKLNNHNPTENDERTHYYSLYGSTPRIAINGDAQGTSTNYASASTYAPYQGDSSAVDISFSPVTYYGPEDSVEVEVTLKTVTSHSLGTLKLFVGLTEDTIFYDAPNGEDEHYNVFRKAMTDIEGMAVNAPANAGDSAVYRFKVSGEQEWDTNRMNAIAILQDGSTKEVVQSNKQTTLNIDGPVGTEEVQCQPFELSPNPVSDVLKISGVKGQCTIQLTDIRGALVKEFVTNQPNIDLSDLKGGIYFVRVTNKENEYQTKMIVKE